MATLPFLALLLQVGTVPGGAQASAPASPPSDTLRLTAREAMARVLTEGSALRAARLRAEAAVGRVEQAGAWRNPNVAVSAENIGAQQEITGRTGVAGLEGQAVLTVPLLLGGKRGASIDTAEGMRGVASATAALVEGVLRVEAVETIAAAARDAALAGHAAEEAMHLARFARALARRADEGRGAGGEAARARLEAASAASLAARRRAVAAQSGAQLARLLGVPATTPVTVTAPACVVAADGGSAATSALLPEERAADARVQASAAAVRAARARAVPDLFPQLGLRRTQAFSGLFLGLGLDLPLLNRERGAIAAARAEFAAAEADSDAVRRRVSAERAGSIAAATALEEAAPQFGAEWRADLARTIASAQARYDAGEGTLAELFDARRARLVALDEFETWRAERRRLRAHTARLAGGTVDEQALCEREEEQP